MSASASAAPSLSELASMASPRGPRRFEAQETTVKTILAWHKDRHGELEKAKTTKIISPRLFREATLVYVIIQRVLNRTDVPIAEILSSPFKRMKQDVFDIGEGHTAEHDLLNEPEVDKKRKFEETKSDTRVALLSDMAMLKTISSKGEPIQGRRLHFGMKPADLIIQGTDRGIMVKAGKDIDSTGLKAISDDWFSKNNKHFNTTFKIDDDKAVKVEYDVTIYDRSLVRLTKETVDEIFQGPILEEPFKADREHYQLIIKTGCTTVMPSAFGITAESVSDPKFANWPSTYVPGAIKRLYKIERTVWLSQVEYDEITQKGPYPKASLTQKAAKGKGEASLTQKAAKGKGPPSASLKKEEEEEEEGPKRVKRLEAVDEVDDDLTLLFNTSMTLSDINEKEFEELAAELEDI